MLLEEVLHALEGDLEAADAWQPLVERHTVKALGQAIEVVNDIVRMLFYPVERADTYATAYADWSRDVCVALMKRYRDEPERDPNNGIHVRAMLESLLRDLDEDVILPMGETTTPLIDLLQSENSPQDSMRSLQAILQLLLQTERYSLYTSLFPPVRVDADPAGQSASEWTPGRLHVSPQAVERLINLDLKLLVSDYDGTLEVNRFFQRRLERLVLYPLYTAGTTPSHEQERAFNDLLDDRTQRFDALYKWVREHRLQNNTPYPYREEVFAAYLEQARRELEESEGEIASTLRLIPSAKELFSNLAQRGVNITIATNDFASVKRLQLRRNGFDIYVRHKDVHGLSDSGRDKLPKDEVIRQEMTSRGFAAHQVAILGDTVQEVRAARATGVLSLAIAESVAVRAELLDAGADIVVDGDYSQRRELLELLFLTAPITEAEGSGEQFGEESCVSRALENRYQAVIDAQSGAMATDRYAAVPVAPEDLKALTNLLTLQVLLLRRRGQTVVKLHPQGFLQVNLTDLAHWEQFGGLRLHIWDPTLQLPDEIFNQFHSHSFQSDSIVMLGHMTDGIFDVIPAGAAEAPGPVLRKYTTPMYAGVVPSDELVQVQERRARLVAIGERVHYPMEDYHLTMPSGVLTATLFCKYGLDESEGPAVTLGPEEVPDFKQRQGRRTYPQDLAWGTIHRVITQLAHTYDLSDVRELEHLSDPPALQAGADAETQSTVEARTRALAELLGVTEQTEQVRRIEEALTVDEATEEQLWVIEREELGTNPVVAHRLARMAEAGVLQHRGGNVRVVVVDTEANDVTDAQERVERLLAALREDDATLAPLRMEIISEVVTGEEHSDVLANFVRHSARDPIRWRGAVQFPEPTVAAATPVQAVAVVQPVEPPETRYELPLLPGVPPLELTSEQAARVNARAERIRRRST